MKKYVFIVIMCVIPAWLFSQNKEIIEVEANTNLADVIISQYLYPEFKQGRLMNKNGRLSQGLLNYNVLLNQLHFIEKNDTLAVANAPDIMLAIIGNNTLVNLGKGIGFGEVIEQNNNVQLVIQKKIEVSEPPPVGAYGMRSETSSTLKVTKITDGGSTSGAFNDLSLKEAQIKRIEKYYLNKDNKIYVANKKNFLKVFPKHKNEIENYLKKNSVNFSDIDTIKELFDYCISL